MKIKNHVMRRYAFSLTEIMIAASVVAVFVTLPVIAFQQYNKRARDERRKTDISRVQQALEQYKAERGTYPVDLSALKNEGYLESIPLDPKKGQAAAGETGLQYGYEYSSDGIDYTLSAVLEGDLKDAGGSGVGEFNGGTILGATFSGSGSGFGTGRVIISGNVAGSVFSGTFSGPLISPGGGVNGTVSGSISGSISSGNVQGYAEGQCTINGNVSGSSFTGTMQVCSLAGAPLPGGKGKFILKPEAPGGNSQTIAKLTEAARNPTAPPPTKTPYLSPTPNTLLTSGPQAPDCTQTIVCDQACGPQADRCDTYSWTRTDCWYTTRPNFAICTPVTAPNQNCPVSGQVCAKPGTGCVASYCRPHCNSGPSCTGACKQIAGRCAPPGSYASTRGSCQYTTISKGACFPVGAPDQPCSISSGHNCAAPDSCVGNFCATPTPAAPGTEPVIRTHRVGDDNWSTAQIGRQTGDVFEAGAYTYDFGYRIGMYITAHSRSGQLRFSRRLRFTGGDENLFWMHYYSAMKSTPLAVPADDGGVFVVAHTHSSVAGVTYLMVVRYAGNGNLLWYRIYGAPGYGVYFSPSAAAASGTGLIIAGQTDYLSPGRTQMAAVRINSDGSLAWAKVFGNSQPADGENSYVNGIYTDSSGGFTLVGHSNECCTTFGGNDIRVLRITPDGQSRGATAIGTPGYDTIIWPSGVQAAASDGTVIVGATINGERALLQLNSQGYPVRARSVTVRVEGVSTTSDGGAYLLQDNYPMLRLVRVTSGLTPVWSRDLRGQNNCEIVGLTVDHRDNAYFSGLCEREYFSYEQLSFSGLIRSDGVAPSCSANQPVTETFPFGPDRSVSTAEFSPDVRDLSLQSISATLTDEAAESPVTICN